MNEQIMKLLSPPDLNDCKKVLCVQPHPDDNEIGMGGIIGYLTSQGCRVDYLTITDGALGDLSIVSNPEKLGEIRKNEAEKAGRILGVEKFLWLNYPDGSLHDITKLAGEIGEIIRENQYDIVFVPDPWLMYEAHQDHIITGKAVAQAAINCSLRTYPKNTLTKPYELKGIGFYFTAAPNTIIDITDHFEQKFSAMSQHQSQLTEEMLFLYKTFFTIQGQKLSQSQNICEGVKMLAPIHLHCFVDGKSI